MKNNAEKQYLKALKKILRNGIKKPNRTGVDSVSLFDVNIKHDYSQGFPLLTTKKMFTKGIVHELLWFLKGTEDASYLIDNKVRIWDEWMVDRNGQKVLPHTYGVKWRNFYGTDQIQKTIDKIKKNPDSRRFVVSAWDAANEDNAALPWCHIMFILNIVQDKHKPPDKRINDGKLGDINIKVVQRSADFFFFWEYRLI